MLRLASVAVFQMQCISCSEGGGGGSHSKLFFFSSGQMIQKAVPSFNTSARLSDCGGKPLKLLTLSFIVCMFVKMYMFWSTSKTSVLKEEQSKFWGLWLFGGTKKEKYFVKEW